MDKFKIIWSNKAEGVTDFMSKDAAWHILYVVNLYVKSQTEKVDSHIKSNFYIGNISVIHHIRLLLLTEYQGLEKYIEVIDEESGLVGTFDSRMFLTPWFDTMDQLMDVHTKIMHAVISKLEKEETK